MNDTIKIIGLKFSAKHGVLPEEKNIYQPFEVDVELKLDLSKASESDNIEDTVNYSHIAAIVKEVVKGESCCLIERLAGKIIEKVRLLITDGEIIVRVRKPRAPLDAQFDTVEVELKRTVKINNIRI
jgi:7,8-dihydroneopterin aldolase/epimerase/oxygenase